MKVKSTKKALIASLLMLAICFTSLVGTTFAWFTDSVSSEGNKIVAGTLDIDLVDANGATLAGEMIEWAAKDGRAQNEIFWEPGCTYETEEFYIVNNGNLNLKFKFDVTGISGDAKLLEVMDFNCMAKAEWFKFNTGAISIETSGDFDLLKGFEYDTFFYGVQHFDEYVIEPGDKVGPIKLQGHMDELAGNEYMGLSIDGIAVSLIATQATGEEDSFDGAYDEAANFSYYTKGSAVVLKDANGNVLGLSDNDPDANGNPQDVNYVKMWNQVTGGEAGSVMVPNNAIDPEATSIDVFVVETDTDPAFTVKDGYKAQTFDVTVTGIKEGNTALIKVTMNVGKGYGADLEVYHDGVALARTEFNYNASTGVLWFLTDSFSPFQVVYNPDPDPVDWEDLANPSGLPVGMPTANVVEITDTVKEYNWADKELVDNFAGEIISGVVPEQKLNIIYKFSAPNVSADINPYLDWGCDYVVSIDRDVAAGVIALGGNYGEWGWIGFTAKEAVAANEEIYLLGIVGGGLSLGDVISGVQVFNCGVAPAYDVTGANAAALAGAKFTVKLRLTNPNPEVNGLAEYYDVNEIVYTFPAAN